MAALRNLLCEYLSDDDGVDSPVCVKAESYELVQPTLYGEYGELTDVKPLECKIDFTSENRVLFKCARCPYVGDNANNFRTHGYKCPGIVQSKFQCIFPGCTAKPF